MDIKNTQQIFIHTTKIVLKEQLNSDLIFFHLCFNGNDLRGNS